MLGCDDVARSGFLNRDDGLAPPGQSHSNLWFLDPEELDSLGPPLGRGAVWLDEEVDAGEVSDPFLFSGFDQRGVHLAHGAEEGRTSRITEDGKIIDFAYNEKCAAGAGSFAEAMARALEIPLEEFGPLSLESEEAVQMNAQCAVFAESEVVSLVHSKTSKEDIARAVHDAIASRITSMLRRVGIEKEVVLIGGLALNPGFVDALKRDLEMEIYIPEDPEFAGALGAAIAAGEKR